MSAGWRISVLSLIFVRDSNMVTFSHSIRATRWALLVSLLPAIAVQTAIGQQSLTPSAAAPPPCTAGAPLDWTAEQDHQNMMDQLGIKALRPGPSGDEK